MLPTSPAGAGFSILIDSGWSIPALLVVIVITQQIWIYVNARNSAKREELFKIITENAADMIALVNVKGRRLYNSPAYHKVLGYTAAELARTPIFEQIHPDDRARVLEASRQAKQTGIGQSLQYRIRHKNGSWRVLESTASTIRNSKGEVDKLVIVNRDVTARKEVEQKLAHDALHDALTGLPNRRLFLERLQRGFTQAKRDPNFRYAVLLVDIDHFKDFNTDFGPAVADRVLVEIAHRLDSSLRAADTVSRPGETPTADDQLLARFAGDGFTILLEAIHDPSDAMRIANRIQSSLALPFHVEGIHHARPARASALRSAIRPSSARMISSMTPRRRCDGPRRLAGTAQSSSIQPCTRALSVGCNWKMNSVRPLTIVNSASTTSRLSRSRIARLPGLKH